MIISFQIHRTTNGSVKTEVASRLIINGKRDSDEVSNVNPNVKEAKKHVQIELQPLQHH